MQAVAEKVIKHKRLVLICFLLTLVVCFVLNKLVVVNYNLLDYLPKEAKSTLSMQVMNQEFSKVPPNARVLITNTGIPEALEFKEKLRSVEGVKEINWLDDVANLYQPLETMEGKVLDSWYKADNALFTLVIEDGKSMQAVKEIRAIIDGRGEITGEIVDTVAAKEVAESAKSSMILILGCILVILVLTSTSWFEPVLFLATIGIAIAINNGTNFFLGSISNITQTTSSILQLAVSMDYAIFLLHRFRDYREEGLEVQSAMSLAMKNSFPTILASGVTTMIGFAALVIMRFGLGPDMGIVLTKAVIFSLLSVMLLLPVLTLYTYKLIDKTQHRLIIPPFEKFGRFALKAGIPILVLVAILVVPSFLAQQNNHFLYGASGVNAHNGIPLTEQLFGKANNMVMLVPTGNVAAERELSKHLNILPFVNSVISYTENIGDKIPAEFVPEDKRSNLMSPNYSRIIITVSTEQEGDAAFAAVEEIRAIGQSFYGDDYYLAGGSVNVYDMKETIVADNIPVTIVGIVGIAIMILLTFRSLSIPIILVSTIESAIWINLAYSYFANESVVYIAYIVLSSIQLGATVDYAILFSSRYVENRQLYDKKTAVVKTISETALSILTSASILVLAGFVLSFTSASSVTAQLGMMIGRGTLLSCSLVLFLLPTLLMLLDRLVAATTLKSNFKGGKNHEKTNITASSGRSF